MIKRLARILFTVTLAACFIPSILLLAAYSASFTVTENNSAAYTQVGIKHALNTTALVSGGYIASTGLDVAVNKGGTDVKTLLANDRLMISDSLAQGGTNNYSLTTGNTPKTSMPIITGYNGYITVPDAAALEPGNNFEFEYDGYINTAGAANILVKTSVFALTVSAANTLTATIGQDADVLDQQNTTGATELNTYSVYWEGQTFTPAVSGSIRKVDLYLNKLGSPTNVTVSIKATSGGLPTGGNLATVTVSGAAITGGAWNTFTFGTPTNLTASTLYAIVVSCTGDGSNMIKWLDDNGGNPYAGGTRVTSTNSGSSWSSIANGDSQFKAYYYIYKTAVASAISSGDHNVKVTADTTNLKIYVDSVEKQSTALSGASVPNNSNAWVLGSNATPYMDYYKMTIGGVLIAHYQPVGIIGGAVYSTGTVAVTNNSAAVVGSGTTWTSAMAGGTFVSADAAEYVILSVTDTTHLTLASNYGGGSLSGQAYNMYVRLPDRQGTAQDGRITWGSNPAGITTSLGSLRSEQDVATGDTGITTPGLGGGTPVLGNDSGTTSGTFIDPIMTIIYNQTGTPVDMQWWALYLGMAIILMVFVFAKTQSGLMSGAVFVVVTAVFAIGFNTIPDIALGIGGGVIIGGVLIDSKKGSY